MVSRRRFLLGIGGVAVALPWLETFAPKTASAAPSGNAWTIILRTGNGVVQAHGGNGDPEMYWPRKFGALTKSSMAAESDRAVSELADYADKLLLVQGIKYGFPGNGCAHSGSGNQCLTAAKVSSSPSGNKSLAMGESIDNRIARELTPNVEPLTLYAGPKYGYIDEVLSYRGALQLRSAEAIPFNAYKRLFGLPDADTQAAQIASLRRKSVNDMVRGQMNELLARKDLSKGDRERLDLHFSSIRDTEIKLLCQMPQARIDQLNAETPKAMANDEIEVVVRMQMDILALAVSCGGIKAATLQIGSGNDGTDYILNNVKQPHFHQISHRIFSDGATGDPIPDAVGKHHQIDRNFLKMFKYLLDKLSSYKLTNGTLLDQGITILTNDLGAGVSHSYENLPYVMAGSAGGYLKTGLHVDAKENGQFITNNRILNTIGAAVGCKNGAGPLDNFGDPSLKGGLIPALLA
jgi:hypothetical protein